MKNVMICIGITVLLLMIYIITTGFLPYIVKKDVDVPYKQKINSHNFYGTQQCVDRVALVEEPLASLETRVHILDEAKQHIDVSYYAMHMGETTDLFLASLLSAAERGVKVRILVDGMSGGLTSKHKQYAVAMGAHKNIELKLYNRVNLLKPWTINGRLHDKYIIVDNRLLLLGGRNIGDKYFNPDGYTENLSIDRDVLVYNTKWNDKNNKDSVLYQVRNYMDLLWDSKDVKQPFSKDTKKGNQKRQQLLQLANKVESDYPELFDHTAEDYSKYTFPANKITFIHNPINIGQKQPTVAYALNNLLQEAKTSVILQSPYVVLDKNFHKMLSDLGKKNIDYQILTNSLASSPNLPAYSAYTTDRKKILKTGARVWEYQSRHAIHAKTYVIDNRMAVVGSFNLDPRSAYIDTELMLAIDSPQFATYLRSVQRAYQDRSLELKSDGTYLPGVKEEKVSKVKSFLIGVLSVPIRLVKFLV